MVYNKEMIALKNQSTGPRCLFGIATVVVSILWSVTLGVPEVKARSKRADNVEAANAAKDSFSQQDGESTGAAKAPSAVAPRPIGATRTLTAEVAAAHREDGLVMIQGFRKVDGENRSWAAAIDPQVTPVIAQDRKNFQGRRRLQADDLEVGLRLKVVFRADSQEIVKIKVPKKQPSAG